MKLKSWKMTNFPCPFPFACGKKVLTLAKLVSFVRNLVMDFDTVMNSCGKIDLVF